MSDVPQLAAKLCFYGNQRWRPPPSWILLELKSDGTTASGTSFSVSVPNFLRIYAITTELWALNGIHYSRRRRHLEFTSGVNFGHNDLFQVVAVYIPSKFRKCVSTDGALLRFMEKFKIAASAHYCYWVILGHPRSLLSNFSCWSSWYFTRYRDLNILQTYIKTPIPDPVHVQIHVFWTFLTPKRYFSLLRPPKGTTLAGNTRLSTRWSQ